MTSIDDLAPSDVPVYGYIYDVKTGRLNEVKAVTEAGKAAAGRPKWAVSATN
jgi:hypothetical protein